MSVELIRRRWCDGCTVTHPGEQRQELPEDYTPILVDLGHGKRHLDICERCEGDMTWLEMVQLYVQEGRPMKSGQGAVKVRPLPTAQPAASPPPARVVGRGSTGTADKQPCPFCPKSFTAFSEARVHIHKVHRFDTETIPAVCPVCADNRDRIRTLGGLRMHTSRVHGLSVLGSLVEGRRLGDPRGAYSAVARLAGVEVPGDGEASVGA